MNDTSGLGPQLPLPISAGDRASFDNFWVGHNSELVAALKACVVGAEHRLIYIYGPQQSGKSHLLFASMRLAREEIANPAYVSLAEPQMVPALLDGLDHSRLVCVDNIDEWAGNAEYERSLFALFEKVKYAGGQLLVSASRPPAEAGFVLADLISRLGSGLIYALKALRDEQQFAALRMRAQQRGLSISDEAVTYLLRRTSRAPGELFAILNQLDRASLIEQRKITVPFLQRLLGQSEVAKR